MDTFSGMKIDINSIVIVTNNYGSVATLRFTDVRYDKILSHSSKDSLYISIEDYVKQVLDV